MKRQWTTEIASENFKLYKENRSARRAWEIDAIRFDDFRYSIHFSKAEEKEMLAFRQAPLPISITTAICDTAEAMMIASKPTIRVAPIINPFDDAATQLSKDVAARFQYLIQKAWYDSLGGLQHDRVVRDSSNVGHGFYYVVPRREFGEFNVDIKHLSWRYVYPHSQTKDPFYRDMDNCIVAMRVSRDYGYRFIKGLEPDITREWYDEECVKGNIGTTDAGEPITRYSPNSIRGYGVLFVKRMVLEEHTAYLVVPQGKDSIGRTEVKFYPEKTPEMIAQERKGEIIIKESKAFFLTEYTSVGNKGYKEVYPIRKYNLIPLVYDHRDTPYPLGRIWYLYPLQRALNKFIMVALLNGSLMNGIRMLAEENSLVNEHEWAKNFAIPGSKLFYKLPIPGQSKPPQIIEGKPLGEQWLKFPQYLAYIMGMVSGIFGVMMGDSRETPDVFSTVASLQSAGGLKMKRRLAQADATLSVVGEVVGEFYREYAPINGYSTMINENGEEQPPMTYNVIEADKNNPQKIAMRPETDLSRGFKSIRFTTQPSQGFESGTEAALLTNLATQLKVPQLVPLILKRLNIPDVDKIVDQLSLVNQQASTIEQLTGTIKDLDKRTTNLANQITQKQFEVSKAQFDSWFAKYKADIQSGTEVVGGNGR